MTSLKPAESSPPSNDPSRRASIPCCVWLEARRHFATSKDVMPTTAGYTSSVFDQTHANHFSATSEKGNAVTPDTVKTYIAALATHNKDHAHLRQLAQEVAALEKLAQLKRQRPLDDQITTFMRSLPPAQRDRAWSMGDLLPHLTGKYRATPHAKEVGLALRRLGWSRKRLYAGGYDGARYWFPASPQL